MDYDNKKVTVDSSEKLIEKAGLKGEEYGGLRRAFYGKSVVIIALKKITKRIIELCKGGKCEEDDILKDDENNR